jgi:hypothetical protein
MRRHILTAAAAVALAGALATPALATTSGRARPAPAAATTSPGTPAPSPASTSPPTPGPSDSAGICLATASTVTKGLQEFVAQMRQVGQLAQQGDLAGADQAVKAGGARLMAIGTQLRADAANASGNLKQTVTTMAQEFESLGRSLTGLTALQHFDTAKLDALAGRMSQICGVSPSPSGSSPVPLPSGSSPVPLPSLAPTS